MTPAEELALVRHELERLCHQRLAASFDPATRVRYMTLTEDELRLMRLLRKRSPVDP